jgi:hypothetical protein
MAPSLTADDFAAFFHDKVAKIRQQTATAQPPVITPRDARAFGEFTPVTVEDIIDLINKLPTKSCLLDPIPTWLLKQLVHTLAPVISNICNLSMQSGAFPTTFKHFLSHRC